MFLSENKSLFLWEKRPGMPSLCIWCISQGAPEKGRGANRNTYLGRERGRGGETDFYFKELAHAVVGASKSEVGKAHQQAGTQEGPM